MVTYFISSFYPFKRERPHFNIPKRLLATVCPLAIVIWFKLDLIWTQMQIAKIFLSKTS